MGCKHSVPLNSPGDTGNSSHHNRDPAPPPTRKRTDSWANHPANYLPANGSTDPLLDQPHDETSTEATKTSKAPTKPRRPAELQWKFLWETHAPHLVDPVDVPAVLDMLLDRTLNQLTSVQMTWILRRVRKTLSNLPNAKVGMLNSNPLHEARVVAKQNHVLQPDVWRRLLPSSCSTSHPILQKNLECILQSFSSDWERPAAAAKCLDYPLDVNKPKTDLPIPKPSSVPDLLEAASTSGAVTLQALATVVALGLHGTRAQQLQLLFYLCLEKLADFLAYHPAGGVPIWLLEVDSGIVSSLASLTHYHYYGTAFLPLHSPDQPPFLPSSSRAPVKVHAWTVYRVVEALLAMPEEENEEQEKENDLSNSHHHHHNNGGSHHNGNATTSPKTPSLQDFLSPTATELVKTRQAESCRKNLVGHMPEAANASWTLQEYKEWAEEALDDAALEIAFHRLLGAGTLPTFCNEKEWVRMAWESWRRQTQEDVAVRAKTVWGGLGGLDGGGGTGHGILYCLDTQWWDSWVAYTGWSWFGEPPQARSSLKRPGPLSTQRLLEPNNNNSGSLGSYHLMANTLHKNQDYVLVPPPVWNVLYELYGGGPPLPRMIRPAQEQKLSDANRMSSSEHTDVEVNLDDFVEQLDTTNGRVPRLPETLAVTLHPWILHCQLCDPTQPYRRGDAGLTSIRLMVTPDQPLSRLLAELVVRFPLMQAFKSADSSSSSSSSNSNNNSNNNKGKVRVWKRTEVTKAATRYGPWNLLCKSRHAVIPMPPQQAVDDIDEAQKWLDDWNDNYTDHATVESVGLVHQDRLLLEFAVQNTKGTLIWPREAAAKAGRVRRLVEEEAAFRRLFQGVDAEGNALLQPPNLVGMDVDAMDGTGRWYTVKILRVEIVDGEEADDEDETAEEQSDDSPAVGTSSKRVQVDFSEHGGHLDWIDVESDRLGPPGRFTNEAEVPKATASPQQSSTTDTKSSKPVVLVKRNSSVNGDEITKICSLPGYGACGLTNLGNTCYMNSALQCISYLPLLRAYLLSSQYKATGDLNKDNPLGTGGKFLEESAELLRIMWSARLGEKSPTRFKSQLGKTNEQFFGADQQDAQEFLNFILDVLHEDSNRVRKKPYVEALEDDWVKKTSLPRVGEEAWRRFLRRNRSIMADVSMGQVLNTVTCPVCDYSSRNFDPFNLLSIPIPTVADVIFQCTVYRRATSLNAPWILNRARKGSSRSARFSRKSSSSNSANSVSGPPSDTFVAEQYVVTMSRLADSGDLRLQIQNLCGIPANQLRLCRADEVDNEDCDDEGTVLARQMKLVPLNDKEGPCSQLAKKRLPNDDSPAAPTVIIAFENTLRSRPLKDKGDRSEDETVPDDGESLSAGEQAEVNRYIENYGDEKECRIVDSDPIVLSKAISRYMWPKEESDFRVGLRVDAKDHRGNWFAGSVIDIYDDIANGGDADTGEEVKIETRKVCVHFDNFSFKWDETYSIEHFQQGQVRPLYAHASPRPRPTEFLVYNRHTDSKSGESVFFGQPFYIHCRNEWTNARAGAQILAQASRFLQYSPGKSKQTDSPDRGSRSQRIYEKSCAVISDLIDVLVDYDREYLRAALAVSEEQNGEVEKKGAYDPSRLAAALAKKVTEILARLPFEIRRSSMDPVQAEKSQVTVDEDLYPFSLVRTIGNFMNARNVLILQWRDPPREKGGTSPSSLRAPVMYVNPIVQVHQDSAEMLKNKVADTNKKENGKKKTRPGSAGMDLGVCLTEFCKVQKLALSDNWRCPRCKEFREGKQDMNIWRLPDLLTFHIKRFNMSARWREKITTRVNFPLTGLDLSEWCHKESPVLREASIDSNVYDLIGVMNHYGSMTGGHYVATCRATSCSRDGKEEVAYMFNGVGVGGAEVEESETSTGWRLGRPKAEVNQNKVAATMSAKSVSESAEPMWLQFDDELVEPLPPDQVVSEMAYVLFYRRRQITPSNIARYSTLE